MRGGTELNKQMRKRPVSAKWRPGLKALTGWFQMPESEPPMFCWQPATRMRKWAPCAKTQSHLFKTQFLKQVHVTQSCCSRGRNFSSFQTSLLVSLVTWELFSGLMVKPLSRHSRQFYKTSNSRPKQQEYKHFTLFSPVTSELTTHPVFSLLDQESHRIQLGEAFAIISPGSKGEENE